MFRGWRKSIRVLVFVLLYLFVLQGLKASIGKDSTVTKTLHEKFSAGEFIFGHLDDAHEWQITQIGHTAISIPLPVILFSKEKGIVAFWSTRFKHGLASYKGFRLETEGINKSKIVETLNDGSEVLPFDISITRTVAALLFSVILILFIFITLGNAYKKRGINAPTGIQTFLEPVILFVRDDLARPSIGEKHYEKYLPFLLTIFFFIWINNMLGLIPIAPGGANVTGNIAVTMVLALCTFTVTTINGNKQYWKHIVNTPGVPVWLKIPIPLLPLVETIGLFTKPFVLMVRLFANITAGHIIGLGFLSLIFLFGEMKPFIGYSVSIVSVSFIIFMTFLELLVAFIQAYVFTFLSALYFGMATEEHEHENH